MTAQQSLFGEEEAPWELDDQELLPIASVVLPTGPVQEFDYRVPANLLSSVEAGRRVRVPLGPGNRPVVAYCVRVETRRAGRRRLKDILGVVDQRSLLSPAMLRLTQWISEHYLCNWGQVLEAVVPAGVRGHAGTRNVVFYTVEPAIAAKIAELKLPRKQAQIIAYLANSPEPLSAGQLAQALRCTNAPIRELHKKGLLHARTERVRQQDHFEAPSQREENYALHPEQQVAFDTVHKAIHAGRHETILLHGITGSGKTEVYIRAIQEIVAFGRQAIVLVPEISLTPQTKQRFRARFGQVAVLHSHLSDGERHWHWDQIAQGKVSVVVGARSAVFAPVPRLGLIVLDEEHESSFKQESAPRYHARDVAIERARAEDVPLVLGSATPSLESWQRAATGAYRLVSMPHRVFDRPLPDVVTVDLRSQDRTNKGAISRQLKSAMDEALKAGGQVILLLNRRGFSTHIQCPACGVVVRCPHCEIALTHHRQEVIALCHYCDYEVAAPAKCPDCQFPGIRYGGQGTQRLEAEVRARFAEYRCLRMDTDTMQGPGSHEKALAAFRAGEVQILLGTQMIAKGLDFPNVTLVGVINADTALHLPDFRAAERTFQLLVQVAGRTGRGEKGGRVLVQTFSPDHPAIQAAARHDYHKFAGLELPLREMLGYPPYATMARMVMRGPVEIVTHEFGDHLARQVEAQLKLSAPGARVLGPAACPMPKLRDKFRFQLQVQGPDGDALRTALRAATSDLKPPDEVQWIVDIDPVDML